MDIPEQVIVGTQTFDIVVRNRKDDGMLNDGTFGYTLDTENLIVVDSALSHSRQKVTLLHEILHAIGFVYDTSVKPKKSDDFSIWEHYFIGIYEEGLLLVLRDNPELLEYLKHA